jgi:pyruvate,water dikinase
MLHVPGLLDLYSESMWINFILPMNMMVRNQLLTRWVRQRAPDVLPSDLHRGLVGLKSLESNRGLQSLADRARQLGEANRMTLLDGNDALIRETLSSSTSGQALVAAVDRFLARYGYLSASGTDLSRVPWIEDPTTVWRAIGRLARSQPYAEGKSNAMIRSESTARVRERLGWWERAPFDRLLASTTSHIALREKVSFLVSADSYELRRVFSALSDGLVARGALSERDDIFYLEMSEIKQLISGELTPKRVGELVLHRRDEMAKDADLDLPDTIRGEYVPARPSSVQQTSNHLLGISGSSGVAEGVARVVMDPAQAPVLLTREDILVVPFSDTSWTPLFSSVGGVVAEVGGQLSHSAIVAREYGVPAVVNVKNATRHIADGQVVVVDGDSGTVHLR